MNRIIPFLLPSEKTIYEIIMEKGAFHIYRSLIEGAKKARITKTTSANLTTSIMVPYCCGKLESPPSIIGSVAISITITMNANIIP